MTTLQKLKNIKTAMNLVHEVLREGVYIAGNKNIRFCGVDKKTMCDVEFDTTTQEWVVDKMFEPEDVRFANIQDAVTYIEKELAREENHV